MKYKRGKSLSDEMMQRILDGERVSGLSKTAMERACDILHAQTPIRWPITRHEADETWTVWSNLPPGPDVDTRKSWRRGNPLEILRLMNPARGNPAGGNPATSIPPAVARKYRAFHEVEPHKVTERTCWVPGELVLLGAGIEINYEVNVEDSAKDHGAKYVHKFENAVKIYRRARANEQADVTWKNFPGDLMVLGYALEFTYENEDGTFETKPAASDKLATTPDGKTLVIIGSSGVKFVARGGKMKVTNWIYH